MQKGGILRCKLKGRMDKGGHYDVEMKRWHDDVKIKREDGKATL